MNTEPWRWIHQYCKLFLAVRQRARLSRITMHWIHPFYLRIANELYLKRLIVGGFDWVYEFSRNFRNEGMDRTHNPEFTILEWYIAYKDYFWMMEITEQLIEKVALALHGTTKVKVGDKELDFKAPFKRVTIFDAIKETTGKDVSKMNEDELREALQRIAGA